MVHKQICIFILFILLILGSCAEEYPTTNQGEDKEEEMPTQRKILEKEEFESYAVNDNEGLEFSCNKQTQHVPILEGKIHVVWSATSEDGITWEKEKFIRQGSVPEVVYFNEKYYMFVMSSCLMYVSDDGLTFEPYTYILKNENLPDDFRNLAGVDPSAIVDNGIIRLFFYEPHFEGTTPIDPALIAGEHSIIEYVSEDAVTWTRVGEAVAVEQITDPDVVLYNDIYYLFLSKGTSVIATSSENGEIFSVFNNGAAVHNLGGVPDTIVKNDAMYMYAHKAADLSKGTQVNINIIKSRDGISWEKVGTAIEDGEAPSIVQLPNGSYRMYYVKRVSEEEYAELVETNS